MGREHRAFALITALIAVTAIFAAAMSLAAISRAALIETGALSRGLAEELGARSAAARVIAGVVGEGMNASGGTSSQTDQTNNGPAIDTDELPDMPEFLREFLELSTEEPEGGGGDDSTSQQTSRSGQRSARFLMTRGLPLGDVRVEIGERVYLVTLTDALGFINVNRADAEELVSLFEAAGAETYLASTLAAQLIDYRDDDDFVSPRGGAEAAEYLRRGMTIPNAPLRAVEELLYLPGMTPGLYRNVRPLVTVFGDGTLHALTSPEAVIAAIPGVGAGAASEIVALRESGALDAKSLEDALPLFSSDIVSRFRFEPSPLVRVRIVSAAGGPRFVGLAVITDDGVQWASFEQE